MLVALMAQLNFENLERSSREIIWLSNAKFGIREFMALCCTEGTKVWG